MVCVFQFEDESAATGITISASSWKGLNQSVLLVGSIFAGNGPFSVFPASRDCPIAVSRQDHDPSDPALSIVEQMHSALTVALCRDLVPAPGALASLRAAARPVPPPCLGLPKSGGVERLAAPSRLPHAPAALDAAAPTDSAGVRRGASRHGGAIGPPLPHLTPSATNRATRLAQPDRWGTHAAVAAPHSGHRAPLRRRSRARTSWSCARRPSGRRVPSRLKLEEAASASLSG
eukprot:177381-Chlamydomonas_euryale.AAC.5